MNLEEDGAACTKLPREEMIPIFFPERETAESRVAARRVCVECPAFDKCRTWAMKNYRLIPEGFFFGEGGSRRLKMHAGKMKWKDWRHTDWENAPWHTPKEQMIKTVDSFEQDNFYWSCSECGQRSSTSFSTQQEADHYLKMHEMNICLRSKSA